MSEEKQVKTWCSKNDCEVVRTGFRHDFYPVCTVCKEELSNSLAKRIEDNENDQVEDQDTMTLWNMYNAQYFGDDS